MNIFGIHLTRTDEFLCGCFSYEYSRDCWIQHDPMLNRFTYLLGECKAHLQLLPSRPGFQRALTTWERILHLNRPPKKYVDKQLWLEWSIIHLSFVLFFFLTCSCFVKLDKQPLVMEHFDNIRLFRYSEWLQCCDWFIQYKQ